MAKTLKEIYEALGKVDGGTEMIADLQDEFSKVRNEAATKRVERNKVLEALGIAAEDGNLDEKLKGIAASITALRSAGEPDKIGTQLAALAKQVEVLNKKNEAAEKKAVEEHQARINETKLSKALAALQKNNAADPQVISQLILNKMVAKDDDSIVFMDNDKEIDVESGVKNFLAANPYLVKNTQAAGSGSAGVAAGAKKTYTADEIKAMTPAQINANWTDIQASLSK